MLLRNIGFAFFAFGILIQATCQSIPKDDSAQAPVVNEAKIKGLTLVAPPDPFPKNPMPAIQAVKANWIAVVPYAFTKKGTASVNYNVSKWKWWGELPEGVAETIRLAQEANLHIMLKPQVYVPNGWTGHLEFDNEADCIAWETDYENYILPFAKMADSLNVEMFCIGTEFRRCVAQRPQFWFDLIAKIRKVYAGKLTYSANWDDYMAVPFWDKLDYIGISAYFPLLNEKTPSVGALKKAWQPTVDSLNTFHEKIKKPILFTEYGYLSVDYCAYRNWELEPKLESLPINEQAQANAIQAINQVFSEKKWWRGGFLWKWFPNDEGGDDYFKRNYTPQGKLAEKVLFEN